MRPWPHHRLQLVAGLQHASVDSAHEAWPLTPDVCVLRFIKIKPIRVLICIRSQSESFVTRLTFIAKLLHCAVVRGGLAALTIQFIAAWAPPMHQRACLRMYLIVPVFSVQHLAEQLPQLQLVLAVSALPFAALCAPGLHGKYVPASYRIIMCNIIILGIQQMLWCMGRHRRCLTAQFCLQQIRGPSYLHQQLHQHDADVLNAKQCMHGMCRSP